MCEVDSFTDHRIASDFAACIQQEKKSLNLSEEQWEDYYYLFAQYFLKTQELIPQLKMTKADVIEVQYAMQKRLFESLCQTMTENDHPLNENGEEWVNKSKKILDDKFNKIPKRDLGIDKCREILFNASIMILTGTNILLSCYAIYLSAAHNKKNSLLDNLYQNIYKIVCSLIVLSIGCPSFVWYEQALEKSLKGISRSVFAKPVALEATETQESSQNDVEEKQQNVF